MPSVPYPFPLYATGHSIENWPLPDLHLPPRTTWILKSVGRSKPVSLEHISFQMLAAHGFNNTAIYGVSSQKCGLKVQDQLLLFSKVRVDKVLD